MNSHSNRGSTSDGTCRGEDTLRLIAGLPAPAGLEDRVKAGLRSSPETGRILLWRGPLQPAGGWMYSGFARGAAAVAIVCIVAGGGWQLYSHVQPTPAAKVIALPSAGSGFSNAGAVRVPGTLQGPVLKHQPVPAPELNVADQTSAKPTSVPPRKKKQGTRAATAR